MKPKTIRLPDHLWEALERCAEANQRSINRQVEHLIYLHLRDAGWLPAAGAQAPARAPAREPGQ